MSLRNNLRESDWERWAQQIITDAESLARATSGGGPPDDTGLCQAIQRAHEQVVNNNRIPEEFRMIVSMQLMTLFPECFFVKF